MQTQTRVQRHTTTRDAVTSGATAFIAIHQAAGGAVIAGGEDAEGVHEDAADAAFHTVGAAGGEGGEGHEVGVPGGAEAVGGGEIEGVEEGVIVVGVGMGVEEG